MQHKKQKQTRLHWLTLCYATSTWGAPFYAVSGYHLHNSKWNAENKWDNVEHIWIDDSNQLWCIYCGCLHGCALVCMYVNRTQCLSVCLWPRSRLAFAAFYYRIHTYTYDYMLSSSCRSFAECWFQFQAVINSQYSITKFFSVSLLLSFSPPFALFCRLFIHSLLVRKATYLCNCQ